MLVIGSWLLVVNVLPAFVFVWFSSALYSHAHAYIPLLLRRGFSVDTPSSSFKRICRPVLCDENLDSVILSGHRGSCARVVICFSPSRPSSWYFSVGSVTHLLTFLDKIATASKHPARCISKLCLGKPLQVNYHHYKQQPPGTSTP